MFKLPSFFRRRNRSAAPKTVADVLRRFRPQLETLEDRLAPATLLVTNNTDTGVSGDGSLRGELKAAAAGDTINFNSALSGATISTGGTLTLSQNVTIDATSLGGGVTIKGNNTFGIFVVNTGITATLAGLTVTGGKATKGGGILNSGTLTVQNSTLSGNMTATGSRTTGYGGAAIFNSGTLMVQNSTLSGNSATGIGYGRGYGGAINNNSGGTATVQNSTLSGNSATRSGGGILNNGTLTVLNSTVSGNSARYGGGTANGGTLSLGNTIVAGNTAPTDADIKGPVTSQGHNLIGDGTSSGLTNGVNGDQVGTTASPLNPMLGPLQNNGGPTQTLALLPGSPAIDAGDNSITAVTTDQRGFLRIAGGTVDIGAFERTTTFVVTSTADSGAGTLRLALDEANAQGGTNTIVFDPSIAGQTITLTSNDTNNGTTFGPTGLVIGLNGKADTLTIQGDLTSGITISGNNSQRIFAVYGGTAPSSLTLLNVTITGGLALGANGADGFGGGGGGAGLGGGVFVDNGAALVVQSSTFTGNTAQGGVGGNGGAGSVGGNGGVLGVFGGGAGGAFGSNGSIGGFGGGGGGVGQSFGYGGGGGFGGGGGGGAQGGGCCGFAGFNGGNNFNGRHGGVGAGLGSAIFNNGGTITLTNSTFALNTTAAGANAALGLGTVFNRDGQVTILNSTFANNTAAQGRAVYNLGDSIHNTGDHVPTTSNTGTVTINNSILGQANSSGPDYFQFTFGAGAGATSSGVGDLIRNQDSNAAFDFGGTVVSAADPLVSALGSWGGPTQTISPLPGSPAINAATYAGAPATDQRGIARPQQGTTDIGAFETRGFIMTLTAGDNQFASINTAFGTALKVTVTAANSDAFSEPVVGGVVTFTAPGSGPSTTAPGATVVTIAASGSGVMTGTSSLAVRANGTAGSYQVAAGTRGVTTGVNFNLLNEIPLTISTQPASITINYGQSGTLNVTAGGGYGSYSYQWYVGNSGNTASPINGATGSSYTASPTSTTNYWVQVTDSHGTRVNSSTATVKVFIQITITVTSTAEGAGVLTNTGLHTYTDTTLRGAVTQADAKVGGGDQYIINFANNLSGTIGLTTVGNTTFGPSALPISTNIVIDGNDGGSGLTITRDATAPAMRLFEVSGAGAGLTLSSLTVSDGLAQGGNGGDGFYGGGGGAGLGGAIFVDNGDTLVLQASTFTGNTAQGGNGGNTLGFGSSDRGGGGGGGLGGAGANYNGATGGAGGGPNGGGAGGAGGFGGGGGGGIANALAGGGNAGFGGGGGGKGSLGGGGGTGGFGGGGGGGGSQGPGAPGFAGGFGGAYSAQGGGGAGAGMGGVVFNNGGTVTITNSTFTLNTTAGGVGGFFGGAQAGAGNGIGTIFNRDGQVTILNSTFANNTAAQGRAIYNLGDSVHNTGDHVPTTSNTGTVTINNSILGQTDASAPDYFQYTFGAGTSATSSGVGNLIRNQDSNPAFDFGGTVVSTADPLLNSLANNGGPTQTMLPAPNSPVLNAGSNAAASGLTVDQRGLARVVNGTVDSGAVEAAPALGALTVTGWTVGQSFSGSIPVIYETGTITLTTSANLPSGLSASLSGNKINITGTPNTAGTYNNVQFTVTDSAGYTPSGTYTIVINSAPSLGALSVTQWTVNQANYSGTINISNGTPAFGSLTVTGLPTGVSASLSNGTLTLSGTPTQTGTFNNIQVSVKDAAGATASGTFTLTVNAAPSLGAALSVNQWDVNLSGYSGAISISNGTGPFNSLNVTGLPNGVSASLSNGTLTLSGTPTQTGSFSNIQVSVKDAAGATASGTFSLTINQALSIGTPPASATIDAGQSDTLSVTATGGTPGYTYQWYTGSPGSGTAISGATSSTYAASSGGSYYVIVTDSASASVTSTAAILALNTTLTISTQPASATIDAGQSDTLSVTPANGVGSYSYQWYTGNPGSGTAISGATGSTYATSTAGSYYVVVSDSANGSAGPASATSAKATVVVNTALSISSQPASATIDAGQSDTLSVTPANGTTPYSYQWYTGSPGSGTAINRATRSTYVTSTAGSYYVVVSDSAGGSAGHASVTSSAATVTVNSALAISTQPASATIDAGQSDTLSVSPSNGTTAYSYQWYTGTSGTTTSPISGATGSSLTVSPSSTTSYWVRVTDSANGSGGATHIDSNTATITVHPALSISTQPASTAIDAGQSDTLSVAAANGTTAYSYQWYTGTSGTTTSPISGATGSSYSASPGSTTSYWVRVTDSANGSAGAAHIDSNTATITVNPDPSFGTLSPAASTAGVSYSGSISVSGGTSAYSLVSATLPSGYSATLSGTSVSVSNSNPSTGTVTFTVTIKDGTNASFTSATETLTINAPLAIAPTTLPDADAGTLYNQVIQVSNGTTPYTTFSLGSSYNDGGTGLAAPTLDATAGTLTFNSTPTASGTVSFTVNVTDTAGATLTQNYTFTVNATPTEGAPSSTAWTVNQAGFSSTVAITGGTGPFANLSVTGLPDGVTASLSGTSVILSGTPTAAGTFNNVQVSLTDAASTTIHGTFSIAINAPATFGSLTASTAATAGSPYLGTVVLTGGTGPFANLTVGGLPPGLSASLNGNTITLSGTPTAAGSFNLNFSIQDGSGAVVSTSTLLAIAPAPAPRETTAAPPATGPSATVAFTRSGEQVTELVTADGTLIEFNGRGAFQLATGVRAASVAFGAPGEVMVVVYQDGRLVQYDAAGAHQLAAGIRSAAVGLTPAGQEVLEVVSDDGTLMQYGAGGAHQLATGVRSASVAFGPSAMSDVLNGSPATQQVLDVVFADGTLVQYDAAGAHQLATAVRSAGVSWGVSGEVLDAVFADGRLLQFDTNGTHRLATL